MIAIKQFAPIFTATVVMIGLYLLLQNRSRWEWIAVCVIGLLGGVLICNYDQIENILVEVGEKGILKIAFQIRKIRDDVFAKAESVKTMGEAIAEQIAINAAGQGRFAAIDQDHRLLQQRDELIRTLLELNSDQNRIGQIIAPLENAVEYDLASSVAHTVEEQLRSGNPQNMQSILDEIIGTMRRSEIGTAERNVRPHIESLGARWNDAIASGVQVFEQFRRTKVLPPQTSADSEKGLLRLR